MNIDYKQFLKDNFNLLLTVVVFGIFLVVTFKACFLSHRMCWEDEAHFWTIVQNLNVAQIFHLMKVEGHMMLWYLVVMPFAKLPFHYYPYPMVALNWLFCLGALIIMWKKAPFNPIIKSLIVLSPAFLSLYSVHARCYSIGIFFLFLACAFYKERLNKPYLYFLILFLAANTSFQALLVASGMGIVFLFELFKQSFKDKKNWQIPIVITVCALLTGIMFYFQLYGAQTPDYEQQFRDFIGVYNPISIFLGTFKLKQLGPVIQIIILRILVVSVLIILLQRFKAFFIYFFPSIISLIFFLNSYSPRLWHTLFFLIYFIVAYWIYLYEEPNKYGKNLLTVIMGIVLISLMAIPAKVPVANDFISPTIMKNKVLKKAKLFSNIEPITLSIILPKLNENGIRIYDMRNRDLSSYEMLYVYFNKKGKIYHESDIKSSIDPNKRNFIITTIDKHKDLSFFNLNKKLYIKGSRGGVTYFIYEVFPDKK